MRAAAERVIQLGDHVLCKRHRLGVVPSAGQRGIESIVVVTDAVDQLLSLGVIGELRARFQRRNQRLAAELAVFGGIIHRGVIPGVHQRIELLAVLLGHARFHVHIGSALVLGALGDLRLGLDLVEQAAEEKLAATNARGGERRLGLHPDLVARGGREIIAQPGAVEALGMHDDEFAGGAELLERCLDLFGARNRQRAGPHPDEHALDATIALGGIQTQDDLHHRLRVVAETEIGWGGVHHLLAEVEGENDVRGYAITLRHPVHRQDDHQHQHKQNDGDDKFQNAVHGSGKNRANPTQERDHGSLSFETDGLAAPSSYSNEATALGHARAVTPGIYCITPVKNFILPAAEQAGPPPGGINWQKCNLIRHFCR